MTSLEMSKPKNKNWLHVPEDFNPPKVGDVWVALHPLWQPMIVRVSAIADGMIFFREEGRVGAADGCSAATLKHPKVKDVDFYPLTEERKKLLEQRA